MKLRTRSLSMNTEIERKFRASSIPADTLKKCTSSTPIQQGYLCVSNEAEVRIRKKGEKTFLTTKKGKGLSRLETEILITEEQFQALWPATEGSRIEKVRYHLPIAAHLTAEIDIFSGQNLGLILVEIEFPNEVVAGEYKAPEWFGIDVTTDNAYKNASLAK